MPEEDETARNFVKRLDAGEQWLDLEQAINNMSFEQLERVALVLIEREIQKGRSAVEGN